MSSESNGYTVALATPENLLELAAIEREAAELFPHGDLPERVRNQTVSPRELAEAQAAGRLWVAASPSLEPVGFALVQLVDGNAHLAEMDVRPRHGRKGLGTLLLRRVIAWARSERFSAVTLTTFSHIPWNAPFYARAGFRVLSGRELGPKLTEILETEASRGLRRRVAMRLELEPRSPG